MVDATVRPHTQSKSLLKKYIKYFATAKLGWWVIVDEPRGDAAGYFEMNVDNGEPGVMYCRFNADRVRGNAMRLVRKR
jgi:hypothetical protein